MTLAAVELIIFLAMTILLGLCIAAAPHAAVGAINVVHIGRDKSRG